MPYKKIIFLGLTFIAAFIITYFVKKNRAVKAFFNPQTEIQFTSTSYNFDTIKHRSPVKNYFVYQNTGNEPFIIDNITSSCGCTVSQWSRKPLLPGNKDSILVQYDAKNVGYFNKSVYVFSNSKTSPEVLVIKGIVQK